MKVKWAAQVLSRSMAAALETHHKVLGSDALDTAEFIAQFNDVFDAVNSSSLSNTNKMRTALSETSGHKEFISKSVNWLSSLKVFKGSKTVSTVVNKKKVEYKVGVEEVTNMVHCLKGWQLTLNCILQLWEVLRDDHDFSFLCTLHLNQDPLEHFFSVVRQKGGNSHNPTPFNFARIYKSISCDKLLKPVKSGNCELDITQILGKLTTCKISLSSQKTNPPNIQLIRSNKNNKSLQQHCIIPSIQQWNAEKVRCLEDNALHYVCGYLMRKVKAWHDCNVCNTLFIESNGYAKDNETFTMLKKFTATSNLVNVSQCFHNFIVRCEKVLNRKI